MATPNAKQLEAARRHASHSVLFVAECVGLLRMHTNTYFTASKIPTSPLNPATMIS